MNTIYLEKLDDFLQTIKNGTFPEYNGKKFKIETVDETFQMNNYWSGGTRSFYSVVELETGKVLNPDNSTNNPFNKIAHETYGLPIGCVLVEHSIFCGKDMGLTFHIRPENLNRIALPEKPKMTRMEALVLIYTKSLKSSYAGISNYRFHEAKRDKKDLTETEWESAKTSCISKGWLNKAGAITPTGRNTIGSLGFIQTFNAWRKICELIAE